MKKLYEPAKIGPLTLKNRLVMAPMIDGFGVQGAPTARSLAYYRLRAQGGVGLIVVGNLHVDPTHIHRFPGAYLHEDGCIAALHPLTKAIHGGGAKAFAQLIHQGRYAKSSDYVDGAQAVAPSATPTRMTGETPRALTDEEIAQLVLYYADAAARAVEAGFDGVELCANSGYLFGQFLSPLTNLRQDRYGGDLEGRMTFLLETVAAVRSRIGAGFPLTVRMGGNDFVPGSTTGAEACLIAARLEGAGVDAISVTGGWHESGVPQVTMDLPHGTLSYLGAAIRREVNIPVIMSNRMDIPTAETLVERGDVDFVALGRPLLADPDAPQKGAQGRYDEIRPCIGCNQGCLDRSMSGESIACLGNAECGQESVQIDAQGRLPTQRATSQPKRILVVGAGPAGMEFARVAALRGHRVTLWEAGPRPGGQLTLAAAPPARQDFSLLTTYLYTAGQKAGVQFEFQRQADAETLLACLTGTAPSFDHLVLATGASPIHPPIPTQEGARVVQAWDVLEGTAALGRRVVVVGGGAVGVETALLLGEDGTLTAEVLRFLTLYGAESPGTLRHLLNHGSRQVAIVEQAKALGRDLGKTTRWIMLGRLKAMEVEAHTLTRVVEIQREGVLTEGPQGQVLLPADTVVLAVGSRSEDTLSAQIQGLVPALSVLGDAARPAKALDAIHAAYALASSI